MDMNRRRIIGTAGLGLAGIGASAVHAAPVAAAGTTVNLPGWFDVRRYGAVGDGKALDSTAINKAIDDAASHGGGTVFFPAGTYASYTIRLKSRITLHLDPGAVILAAAVSDDSAVGGYDLPESIDPAYEKFQDFGHSHWRNSLIWGEGLSDIAIVGTGLIWGQGLTDGHPTEGYRPGDARLGAGNKSISLKNCRNVTLRDFSILQGGWFAILATGVDNFTIDNLKIDTNRDGMDIDCCRNVRVSNCTVNSPWDDGICPKSSFALGYARPTENLTISNCYVTGDFEIGSVIDGTWKRRSGDPLKGNYGRIKLGTESNGGFKNITISNCIFESCRGLALETVDGALLEDISIVGITMRDLRNSPLFLRLGRRMRGPEDAPVGKLRRINISNIVSHGAYPGLCSIISGVPGHPIEDINISDVYLHQKGGGTEAMAALRPRELETGYPEPSAFGNTPAAGFFVRHARNLSFSNVQIVTEAADARPAFWMQDVQGADFFRLRNSGTARHFALEDVGDFKLSGSRGIKDAELARVETATTL